MYSSLVNTVVILITGTISGYFFQKWSIRNHKFTEKNLMELAIFLQKLGMIWLMAITYIGSLWIFEFHSIVEMISLPFVGGVTVISGGIIAILFAKYYKYNRLDTGSLFSCGYFSNIASLGGMVCFFYLGEEGYALVPIYSFFMRILIYGIGYPIARMYGGDYHDNENFIIKIIDVFKDPFFYVGMGAVIIGFLLNFSSWTRPAAYTTINEILIPVSTFILLFSVGINLKFSFLSNYLKECLYVSLIKFVAVPFITLIIAILLNYQSIDDGILLKISLIMSFMPVAFNSVIAANIYNLNVNLVNSCWVFTTFSVIFVLPVLFFFLNYFLT